MSLLSHVFFSNLGKLTCTRTVYHSVNEINAWAPTPRLSPLLTGIQRKLEHTHTQSHSLHILNPNQLCREACGGSVPGRMFSGCRDAWVLSLHHGRPLQLLMTSTGSRPLVSLCSCSRISMLDWQNIPLMWWTRTSNLQKQSLVFSRPWLPNYATDSWYDRFNIYQSLRLILQ